jgi:hypothetical protein
VLLVSVACAVALAACSESNRFNDAGKDLDGGVHGGANGDSGASASALSQLGKACKRDVDCPDGLFCDEEIPVNAEVSGAPGGHVDVPLFPGGSCSPLPLSPYDPDGGTSCDPTRAQPQQGCGAKGTCVSEAVSSGTEVACRVTCDPSSSKSGCSRDGYTCDFNLHACVEGCATDAECRLLSVDRDGDGLFDGVDYDKASKATCDAATARCTHPAAAGAKPGIPCTHSDDCESDGVCVREVSTLGGLKFPGGACTKYGCDVPGRECGDGNVCEPVRPWSSGASSPNACLVQCTVGAEPAALRLGASGHGEGCRDGYRCHYNGGAGADDGVCIGGNYNAVTKNNVGSACENDADCFSPYGYGRCLHLSVSGIASTTGVCTIMDCAVPGMPDAACGSGNECIILHGDVTFCVHNCAHASECATGNACADDDADPSTPSVCFPACFADTECRSGETCSIASTATAGQCVAKASQGG